MKTVSSWRGVLGNGYMMKLLRRQGDSGVDLERTLKSLAVVNIVSNELVCTRKKRLSLCPTCIVLFIKLVVPNPRIQY